MSENIFFDDEKVKRTYRIKKENVKIVDYISENTDLTKAEVIDLAIEQLEENFLE